MVEKRPQNSRQSSRAKNGQMILSVHGPIEAIVSALVGGRETFMSMLRLAVAIEPDLARITEDWDRLTPHAQKCIDLDQLCAQKEMEPSHVIAMAAEAAVKFRDNASLMMAALSMPAVVERSIKNAMTPGGYRDRKMLFEHSKFIPVPQGTRIAIKNEASASAQSNAPGGRGLPTHEKTIDMVDEVLSSED